MLGCGLLDRQVGEQCLLDGVIGLPVQVEKLKRVARHALHLELAGLK
jgi:hypothetical protein